MKKNSRYGGLLLFSIVLFQGTVMAATVQEKHAMYRQLAELENQKRLIIVAYEKSVLGALSTDERVVLRQEYAKKIEEIFQQIEEQKRMLEAATQQELLWNAATFFGGTALLGLLAYKIFTAGQVPQQEQPTLPQVITKPIPSALKVLSVTEHGVSPLEIQQLSQQGFVMPNQQRDTQTIPQESLNTLPKPSQSVDPTQVPIPLEKTKISLTPQEKALYELRYKNLRNAILPPIAAILIGPAMLPIDILLFTISALSGAGATYYNHQLIQQ